MSDPPSDAIVDQRDTLIKAAEAVLAEHVPDRFGLCAGCMDAWSRWVPYPGCTQMQWARRVIETHGVADTDGYVPEGVPDWPTVAANADSRTGSSYERH